MSAERFDQLLLYKYIMDTSTSGVPICNELKDIKEEQNMCDNDILASAKAVLNNMYGYGDNSKVILDDIVDKRIEEKKSEENWVWVTGYKGLDKDMKAYNDFQYEMDQLYIMPDGEPLRACHRGFHMCLKLEDLYNYKSIGDGNRFFECKALVREKDLEKYGTPTFIGKIDKLAAKSIRLVRELSIDEILDYKSECALWPEYIKKMAIDKSVVEAEKEWRIVNLTRMGYARPLAEYICNHCDGSGYDLAVALDAQTDISMDTKVNAIFSHV